jgi:hypothetical protein
MEWINFFNRIVLINLPTRDDRLIESIEQLSKYDIPFELVEAVPMEQGAEGLRATMLKLFEENIRNEVESMLVFEDDVLFLDGLQEGVHDTMNGAVSQLPADWRILYLGCQPSHGYPNFYSRNLLPVTGAFATHACAYSLQAMKDCYGLGMTAPIDNFIVDKIQPLGQCFQTYPFLATQRESYSDIGRQVFSWRPFLETRHEQKISEMKNLGKYHRP